MIPVLELQSIQIKNLDHIRRDVTAIGQMKQDKKALFVLDKK